MADGAALIARRLHEAGCRYAFGIPGGEVLSIVRALGDAGIEFVLAKHENCAGFMAEGVYHQDGFPGVLVATLGPGVANAVNVVANAYQDRVPLVFLSGCVDPREAATYTHQVFDHGAVLRAVTKASFVATDGAVDVIIDKALAIALDGQPGPVHIDVPISVAAAEQPDRAPPRRVRPSPVAPAPGPDLDTARCWLREAERPLVIAGVDVLNQRAEAAVRQFVEKFRAPLITTYKAKGIVPEDHRLSLGGAGLSPLADAQLLPQLARSDLLILTGYDPIEMRQAWSSPWLADARVIEFCAVPNTHYMHQAALSFVGDIGAGLSSLGEGIAARDTWVSGEVEAVRAKLDSAFAVRGQWGPDVVIQVARRTLPRDTVATVDSGAHRILLSQMWECYGPRTLLQSTALCTMGCALPLAIGYKLAAADRPVVAFVGDAGLEMVLGELATLRDSGLPVIVFVFVDESLALIELKQRRMGHTNRAVDFGATDFAAVADALGGHGVVAASAPDLQRAIRDALARDTYTLIACPVGRHAYDDRF